MEGFQSVDTNITLLPAELRALVDFLELDDKPHTIFNLPENDKALWENAAFRALPDFVEEQKHIRRKISDGRSLYGKLRCRQVLDGGKWEVRLSNSYQIVLLLEPTIGGNRNLRDDSVPDTNGNTGAKRQAKSQGESQLIELPDWTQHTYPGMSPWAQFLHNFDWANTTVGPMGTWPLILRQAALAIMTNPEPRLIIWGEEEQCLIYNEACQKLIGEKHPSSMGQSAHVSFAELWQMIEPLARDAFRGRTATMQRSFLPLWRDGFLEETWWNYTLLPIYTQPGQKSCCLDEFTEVTHLVTGNRRRQDVAHLSSSIAQATSSLSELWTAVIDTLTQANVHDMPWAMLFEVVDDDTDPADSLAASTDSRSGFASLNKKCVLAGTAGIDADDCEIQKTFALMEHLETGPGIVTHILKAWKNRTPIMLSIEDGTLPTLLSRAIPGRGFDAPIRNARMSPVLSTSGTEVLAILVTGLNPMCAFKGEYALWFDVLLDIISKAAALISLPQEQRRAQRIADDINQALAQQLRMATIEAERASAKFFRMAASAPTGCFMFELSGNMVWVNDAYLEITGETMDSQNIHQREDRWLSVVHDDDRERFAEQWTRLKEHKVPINIDYRLKKPWTSIDTSTGKELTGDRWLLATAFPEIESDGKISTVQGWVTDISHRKVSENIMAQRLEDALENKRLSENFIDMTSHEMRNPLSAILQSADSIVLAMPTDDDRMALSRDVVEEVLDAAHTIILCAQHQKRIVDDILTLSKLDASLLVISPDRVSAPLLVEKALKMYEAEIMRADIDTSIYIEPSYEEMRIEDLVLDPSRLLQVIINLLTNSIKFTQFSEVRQIQLCLGASCTPPSGAHHNVNFVPLRHTSRPGPPTPQPDWGTGEDVYLQVACKDTGRGLTEDEMKTLFQRFQQASPKTYKQYGGSGLGLFISRELCELQGGQIGVASRNGHTVFAFFVKCKRYVPGPDDNPLSRTASRTGLPIFPSTAASPIAYSRRASVILQQPLQPSRSSTINSGAFLTPLSRKSTTQSLSTMEELAEGVEEKLGAIQTENGTPKKIHVLVVEDNLINQKVMSQQLRRAGCVVHVANHGVECLDFLEKTTFCSAATPLSVILLDLEMPTMGGLECIKNIRAWQSTGKIRSHVPCLCVTANARAEQLKTALDTGFDQVITKPFRIPELIPQIEKLIAELLQSNGV